MTVMPCQCGAKNKPDTVRIRYTSEQEAWQEAWQVRCLECKASSSACDSQADAIRAWNRLALTVQIAGEGLKALRAFQDTCALLDQWSADIDA